MSSLQHGLPENCSRDEVGKLCLSGISTRVKTRWASSVSVASTAKHKRDLDFLEEHWLLGFAQLNCGLSEVGFFPSAKLKEGKMVTLESVRGQFCKAALWNLGS
ncbi:hypothetical protein LINPERHAP2_LOCUS9714 [Linum perenne]